MRAGLGGCSVTCECGCCCRPKGSGEGFGDGGRLGEIGEIDPLQSVSTVSPTALDDRESVGSALRLWYGAAWPSPTKLTEPRREVC